MKSERKFKFFNTKKIEIRKMKESMHQKYWVSPVPTHCQVCGMILENHFIDGRTFVGYWTIMCLECHSKDGVGLGLGKGQKYEIKTLKRVEG